MRFRGQLQALAAAVVSADRGLGELTQFTEAEFGPIGRSLAGISEKARSIVQESSAAAAIVRGAEFRKNIESLERIPTVVESLRQGSSMSRQTLDQMLSRIHQCERLVERFPQLVLVLKVLALHIRSEAAGLREAEIDFSTVADEVSRLAQEIEQRSQQILSGSGELSELIRKTLMELVEFRSQREREISSLMLQSQESLGLFARAGAESAHAAESITAHYQTAYSSLCEVVQSLQVEDMTHQQIDHVREGLGQVRQLVRSAKRNWWFTDRAKAAEAVHLADVQVAQLGNSRRMLAAAAAGIVERLGAILRELDRISSEAVSLAHGETDARGGGLLDQAGDHLKEILTVLHRYDESSGQLDQAMQRVASGIGATAGLADQIEDVGFRLRLAALNAQIKAAHLGNTGAALETLAERIREVTDDATARTSEVADHLRGLAEQVSGVTNAQRSRANAADSNALPELSREISRLLDVLAVHNRSFAVSMERATGAREALRNEIQQAAEQLQSHARMESTFEAVLGAIGEPLGYLRERCQAVSTGREHAEQHARRYTMSSEREVHAGVGSPAPAVRSPEKVTTQAPVLAAEAGAGSDLGDNVELF